MSRSTESRHRARQTVFLSFLAATLGACSDTEGLSSATAPRDVVAAAGSGASATTASGFTNADATAARAASEPDSQRAPDSANAAVSANAAGAPSAIDKNSPTIPPPPAASSADRPPESAAASPTADARAWPSDCENRYVFRAHANPSATDDAKYLIPAGSQFHVSFFFKAPWGATQVQLLQTQASIDNAKVMHHWNLYAFDEAGYRDGEIRGGPGEFTHVVPGESILVAGALGSPPALTIPDDVGLRVPSGANLTLRLELHYFNSTDQDQVDGTNVEICMTSKSRPHQGAFHWLGTFGIAVPPHARADITSTCAPTAMTEPVHIMALMPHMHRTGTHSKVVLERSTGGETILHDRAFAFDEQRIYSMPGYGSPEELVVMPGDSITSTCSYQNDSDATLTFGENTENEMCFVGVFAWPLGQLVNGSPSSLIVPGALPDVNCLN